MIAERFRYRSSLSKSQRWITFSLVTLSLAGLGSLVSFDAFEAKIIDLRLALIGQRARDESIVIITIDDKTLQALNSFSPLSIEVHTRLLELLEENHPRAIQYLIDFNQVYQLNPSLFHGTWTNRFSQASRNLERLGTILTISNPVFDGREQIPPYPMNSLPQGVQLLETSDETLSKDGVSRRFRWQWNHRPSGELLLTQLLLGQQAINSILANDDFRATRFYAPTAEHKVISLIDLLDKTTNSKILQDSILLIVDQYREHGSKGPRLPSLWGGAPTHRGELHAQALEAILNQGSLVRNSRTFEGVIGSGLGAAAGAFSVLWFTPAIASAMLAASFLFGFLLTQGLFSGALGLGAPFYGVYVPFSNFVVMGLSSFYLMLPVLLVAEYRRRNEIQKKHELLGQVETLKTNFLSLISHDLKTPIARIRGHGERLQRELRSLDTTTCATMNPSIRGILESTDELNHFVSSILELHKIDSERVPVSLESRDLEQLVQQVLTRHKSIAEQKGIELSLDSAPVFPIMIDTALTKKVLSNLVDNAIKYSPNNSKVRVSIVETSGEIKVSIRDEGPGVPEDDQCRLFQRFSRLPSTHHAKTTGTGLGLYLSKFFIESQGGRIQYLRTEPLGSEFSIYFPTDSNEPLSRQLLEKTKGQI